MEELNTEPVESSSDDWNDCHPGEVGQLVHRLRSRRRMHLIWQSTSAVGLVGMILIAGYFINNAVRPASPVFNHAGMSCSEVRRLGEDYSAGKLDEKRAAQVKDHLADCESCKTFVENLLNQPQAQPPDAGADNGDTKQIHTGVARQNESVRSVEVASRF